MKLKKFGKTIFIHHRLSSDLHAVEEVEDHLQERTEDHPEEKDEKQVGDVVVGIVFLFLSTDGLQQEMVSFGDVET